jgi:hypothetical protein
MRVISVTPAGRRRYLRALVPHLLRQRHVIDEHHWWLNTTDVDDVRFVERVTAEHPDFFKLCRKPVRADLQLGENIWCYFRDYAEPGTLYVRFDDDILWMADDAVQNLVQFRLMHREPLLVFGNIINNAVCTHFHQQAGLVPMHWGEVLNECMDHNGWWRGEFARRLHALVLDELRHGSLEKWKRVPMPIDGQRRFSINVISWFGDDLRQTPELTEDHVDEEPFLTETLPTRYNRPCMVCPAALFVHFAFYPQRPTLEWTWPELVDHYQALAQRGDIQSTPAEAVLRLVRDTAWAVGKSAGKVKAHARKHWWPREAA